MPSRPATFHNPQTLQEEIRSARAGDAAGLAGLYHRYATTIFRTAYRLCGSPADAEDIVHDVFVGLPEALRRYDERGSFDAWMRRVTVRVALMRARAERRRREDPLEVAVSSAAGPQTDATTEYAETLRAVAALPERQRTVFVLKQLEGFSHDEIGVLLGISAGASRVRLARALKTLRRSLR
jgi:RNA polymerase sigma-70 factor (ECF subfamily)